MWIFFDKKNIWNEYTEIQRGKGLLQIFYVKYVSQLLDFFILILSKFTIAPFEEICIKEPDVTVLARETILMKFLFS